MTKQKLNQREFWNLPEVRAQQEIQKRHPYGSWNHRGAYEKLCEIAKRYDVAKESGLNLEDY